MPIEWKSIERIIYKMTDEQKDKLYASKGITIPSGMSAFGPSTEEWMQMSGIGTIFHNFVNPSNANFEEEKKVVEEKFLYSSDSPKRKFIFKLKLTKS